MREQQTPDITNGFLPAAPFTHAGATAVGMIELGRPLAVEQPAGNAAAPHSHDGLLLVRLHGDPLGVIHVDGDLSTLPRERLAAEIYRQLGDRVREHCERYGCSDAISSAAQLLDGLPLACSGHGEPTESPAVTVIVATSARAGQLARCLHSLESLDFRSFEVIVVDNRPDVPGTAEAVRAASDRLAVRYVAEPRPGSSVARNRGLREATSELVAFLDDDVMVDAEWLRWLVEPFADQRVSATTGLVLPLELATPAQKQFELYAGFSKGVRERHYDMNANRASERILYPYWGGMFGSGCSMAFRRARLLANGGFDPALGAGSIARAGADIEAFTATILGGGELVYQPRSVCWHEHRRNGDQLRDQLFSYGVGFAAILTKHLTRDPRFLRALARTPTVMRHNHRDRVGGPRRAGAPRDLRAVEWRGMVRGPWLYGRSVRWARRLRLYDVINGD